jgi:hypothetical protein
MQLPWQELKSHAVTADWPKGDIVKCCGWDFPRANSGAASRAVSIFSSALPPKPDSSLPYIWLRLGGDEIKIASPKAIPYLFCLSMLGRW